MLFFSSSVCIVCAWRAGSLLESPPSQPSAQEEPEDGLHQPKQPRLPEPHRLGHGESSKSIGWISTEKTSQITKKQPGSKLPFTFYKYLSWHDPESNTRLPQNSTVIITTFDGRNYMYYAVTLAVSPHAWKTDFSFRFVFFFLRSTAKTTMESWRGTGRMTSKKESIRPHGPEAGTFWKCGPSPTTAPSDMDSVGSLQLSCVQVIWNDSTCLRYIIFLTLLMSYIFHTAMYSRCDAIASRSNESSWNSLPRCHQLQLGSWHQRQPSDWGVLFWDRHETEAQ